jgi:acyl-CoA reductase-like NAD-dependent aldehyde dehydrogenase
MKPQKNELGKHPCIFLDGSFVETEELLEIRSPYSGQTVGLSGLAGPNEIQKSIEAGINAYNKLKKLSRFEIACGLEKLSHLIAERKSDFVETIIAESAKPRIYARAEVERAIATFHFAAAEAERFTGEIIPADAQISGKNRFGYYLRVPRGVVYGITPFNFPLNLVAHKVAPAIAAKNAVIIKPSPRTPLTALLLAECFLECGLPPGSLQVMPTDIKNLDLYFNSEKIAFVSFTGSAEVGWQLKNRVGKKAITLELGGNASVIVDRSAGFEASISKCLTGAFAYSGQVCISVQRIYIEKPIFSDWLDAFRSAATSLKCEDPSLESCRFSVMIDENAAQKAESWIQEAVREGAKVLSGGNRESNFIDPTILTDSKASMKVVAEEAFAPLVVIEPFDTIEEAAKLVNDTRYGLQAGVFSSNASNINYLTENLEVGGVIINDVPTFRVDNMPYGGVKDSGFGREGVRFAMQEMSEIKTVIFNNEN